ncbi:MAG: cysteine--tRNA ligase [Eubacteriales bacterium]|nr:cysteine--tRNA ligase [Eubacteriales bacterium]
MRIFNTMTRQKEEFIPIVKGEVRIYACGPTVYNYFHIGNARPFVTFDTLRRYLEYKGMKVIFVQNFTDIDDKMILQANAAGITVRELADRFIAEYYHDADKLNIRRATYQPRATDCITDILEMIKVLENKGYAYVADDGVYFDVEKFKGYGSLSNYNLDELEENAGERLSNDSGKRNKADFALWKLKKSGEPSWDSPWGDGRPGWHIECSAMSLKYLGDTIDIHCGGQDLIFPHHENEIAQSEAVTGKQFVRYWIHNGFININNHKMSKSAGNFFTIREITEKYSYDVIRFFILSSHYRSPINFSDELLEAAQSALERVRNCVESIDFEIANNPKLVSGNYSIDVDKEIALENSIDLTQEKFIEAMEDDLNTADAISEIFNLVRDINISIKNKGASVKTLSAAKFKIFELFAVLGVNVYVSEIVPDRIISLSQERTEAKKLKDFKKADYIREEILSLGYQIQDTPNGPKITKA